MIMVLFHPPVLLRACLCLSFIISLATALPTLLDEAQAPLPRLPTISIPNDEVGKISLMHTIPQYVFDYAPLIHLYSGEEFWPGDISKHLHHTMPYLNYTPIDMLVSRANLSDLDDFNIYKREVYLTSDDNVEDRPDWLGGRKNIPEGPEQCRTRIALGGNSAHDGDNSCPGGRSDAPATLIVVPKENGIVDAFWWFFYSYNLGNKVLRVRFGNHVGDWEYTLVRFKDGQPIEVFLSEHTYGEAYTYAAVEKIGNRPVAYSATGTHAMYATPGTHRYVLPWGLLHDETDRGPLWDPALNSYSYILDLKTDTLINPKNTPVAPTEWFYFQGHWGDRMYEMNDSRQYRFAGQYHYVSGPPGPRYHGLARHNVCPGRGECRVKDEIGQDLEWRKWLGQDDYDNGGDVNDQSFMDDIAFGHDWGLPRDAELGVVD